MAISTFLARPNRKRHAADTVKVELTLIDLSGDVRIADDRTCNELREECYVQQHGKQSFLYILFVSVNVDDIAESLESKERNTDRQPNMRNRDGQSCDTVEYLNKKSGVLIDDQQSDIQNNGKDHRRFVPFRAGCSESEDIVQDYGDQHDHHRDRLTECIEDNAGCGKDEISRFVVFDYCIKCKCDRKKQK